MTWNLLISFHYPHNRFALGWEYLAPDESIKYNTLTLYLFIATIDFNYETN